MLLERIIVASVYAMGKKADVGRLVRRLLSWSRQEMMVTWAGRMGSVVAIQPWSEVDAGAIDQMC